jgi:hypothetical protein
MKQLPDFINGDLKVIFMNMLNPVSNIINNLNIYLLFNIIIISNFYLINYLMFLINYIYLLESK